MPVIPLEESLDAYPGSIKPFLNSLFSKGVRSKSVVIGAANQGADTVSFADDQSRRIIMNSWLAAWKKIAGEDSDSYATYEPYIRQQDYDLLYFLAHYIDKFNLSLCVRPIELSSTAVDPEAPGVPFYRNTEYKWSPFVKDHKFVYGTLDETGKPADDGTVVNFLWLLFHGAHFVYINVASDGATGMKKSFDQAFNDYFSGAQTSTCPGNSHYGGAYGTDDYYLDVDDKVPADPSFILALLVGDTSWGDESNGFMQLEGWQAQGEESFDSGGPRHHKDYKTYQATLWNISTFGASAYSEKRCTTVFLAQTTFSSAIAPDTHMPHYDGAGSVQDWMTQGYVTGGPIDEVVADVHDDVGHLYFFQGTNIIHYDPSSHTMHDGYPQPIENIFPGLAALGFDTIDAAYSVPKHQGTDDDGTYYFFKGTEYVHYNPSRPQDQRVKHNIVPTDGSHEKWPGLAAQGFTSIDGVAYGPSSGGKSDKIHFFKGTDYLRFDLESNRTDHHALLDVTVGGAEFVSNRLLLVHNDEMVSFDIDSFEVDWSWGAAAIYGKNVFPGLWWAKQD